MKSVTGLVSSLRDTGTEHICNQPVGIPSALGWQRWSWLASRGTEAETVED